MAGYSRLQIDRSDHVRAVLARCLPRTTPPSYYSSCVPFPRGLLLHPEMNEHVAQNYAAFDTPKAIARDAVFGSQDRKIDLIVREIEGRGPFNRGMDIGCYTGLAGVQYKRAGIRHLTGVDISEEALAIARTRGVDDTRVWLVGEASAPFESGAFQVVIMGDVIEHIINTDFAVAEIRRCLSDNGRFIVTTPNLAYWWSRVRLLMGRPPVSIGGVSSTFKNDFRIDLNHIRVSTVSEWKTYFAHRGFTVERIAGWSLGHYPMRHRPLLGQLSRAVDAWMTCFPNLAFGIFLSLKKSGTAFRDPIAQPVFGKSNTRA